MTTDRDQAHGKDPFVCGNPTSAGPCPLPFGHHPLREHQIRPDGYTGPACTDDGEPAELTALAYRVEFGD
jgi:hypothetical protein